MYTVCCIFKLSVVLYCILVFVVYQLACMKMYGVRYKLLITFLPYCLLRNVVVSVYYFCVLNIVYFMNGCGM